MVAKDRSATLANRRRSARDLIGAVLENMRRNLEPLKYSTLAPSRYLVYVHPTEFARLEGIIPILQEETTRALTEELARLNNRSGFRRYRGYFGDGRRPVQTPTGDWHVEFLPDPDGELAEGDILIDSDILLPAQAELGVGERTRRITTKHVGQRTSSQVTTNRAGQASAPEPFARLVYDDESGHHSYDVTSNSITIGRGGSEHHVDVKIHSSVDVSREHARIRRDAVTGRFFLIDLSSLGTTLNNRHVPRGYDEVDGSRRETGAETPLPDQARIGLAETVFLDFTVVQK